MGLGTINNLSLAKRVEDGQTETGVLDGRLVTTNQPTQIEIFLSNPIATDDAKNERLAPNDEKTEIGRIKK